MIFSDINVPHHRGLEGNCLPEAGSVRPSEMSKEFASPPNVHKEHSGGQVSAGALRGSSVRGASDTGEIWDRGFLGLWFQSERLYCDMIKLCMESEFGCFREKKP